MRHYINLIESYLVELDHMKVMLALRNKTVANGCTPEEADAAARKLRQMENKYGALPLEPDEGSHPSDDAFWQTSSLDDFITSLGFRLDRRIGGNCHIYRMSGVNGPTLAGIINSFGDAGFECRFEEGNADWSVWRCQQGDHEMVIRKHGSSCVLTTVGDTTSRV